MAVGVTIAATLASAYAQYAGGQASVAAAKNQAQMARLQGEQASLDARQKAADLRLEKVRLKGAQAAQAAGAGLDLDSKSLVSISKSTDYLADRDINNVLSSGRLALARGNTQGAFYDAQASMLPAYLGIGSTLLGGTGALGRIDGWEGFENIP